MDSPRSKAEGELVELHQIKDTPESTKLLQKVDCNDDKTNDQNPAHELELPTKVSFDDVLKQLGQFGTYQKQIYFLLFLPTIFSSMQKLAWVFLGAKAPHRCRLPEEPLNSTFDQLGRNLSDLIPFADSHYAQCSRYDNETKEIPCDQGWIYDRTTFGSSAIIEWDLVCNDLWMRANAQSLFMGGVLIGSYVFGEASDRLGRKPTLIVSVILQTIFGLIAGVLPDYWSFVLARMIVGMTTSGIFLVSYVLAMEMVGPKYRVIAGTLCQYYFTFGFFAMALLAYFLNNNWRLLQIVITIPSSIFVVYWWIVPESVRWLMSKERYEESKKIILKISAKNGTNVSEEMIADMFKTMNEEKKKDINKSSHGVLDLFKHPHLRRNTLIMFYNWFVNSGTYYGLALSASDLGGNPYVNFMISAAVEIPAYAIILLILNKFGRKIPLCIFMIIAGISLIIAIFIDESNSPVLITLSMIGKLAITTSYGVIYIFSAELFPTSIRNVAVGACSMSARIGGILCPYLNMLVDYWRPLPLIVYGVFAFSGGLLSLMLPETLNKKLPETLDDGENLKSENQEEKV